MVFGSGASAGTKRKLAVPTVNPCVHEAAWWDARERARRAGRCSNYTIPTALCRTHLRQRGMCGLQVGHVFSG
eukprot:COSAG01_NODE_143_length_24153_cov_54.226116_26_plen_73_part_00